MSAIQTFFFGIWSGLVIGVVGFLLLRSMVNGRRERKLRELQRYREARGQKMHEIYGGKPIGEAPRHRAESREIFGDPTNEAMLQHNWQSAKKDGI